MTADISSASWFTKPSTKKVLATLNAAAPEGSRFVGGCVRNTLLGEPVSDIDIATQLLPEETIKALSDAGLRAIPTGIEHGIELLSRSSKLQTKMKEQRVWTLW